MNIPLDPEIRTRKDLLNFFDSMVASGQSIGMISMDACMAGKQILEEEEADRKAAARRVMALEQELARTDGAYRKMLCFLTEMLSGPASLDRDERRTDSRNIVVSVKQLRDILGKDTKQVLVEKAFENLKTAVLSETRNNSRKMDRSRLLGLMGKWLNLPSEKESLEDRYLSLFLHCKKSYLNIIYELRSVLSPVKRRQVKVVEERINKAQDLDAFTRLRGQVVDLLREYMAESANDKAQAVYFAEEISRQILEMDKQIAYSMEAARETQGRNREFNEKLAANIQALKDAMTIGAPMKELTHVINQKISLLSETLNQKKARDYSEEQKLKNRIAILKKGMKKVRDGFKAAKRQNQALEAELNTDHLTGVANRRAYEAGISREMNRFSRYHRPFALVIFDVDRFKQINDTYGHAIGDKCLKEIAGRIKPTLRSTDILARTGGDEFVLILPETDGEQAGIVADKIRLLIWQTEFLYRREKVRISLSLGITHVLENDSDYEAVFKRADKALYQSKESGRNKISVEI